MGTQSSYGGVQRKENTVIVRRMLAEEIDATVTLVKYYYDEAAEAIPTLGDWDTNSVINTIRGRSINPQLIWLNAYDNGRPVGMISGSFNTAPWNEDIVMASIDLFYILPSHRDLRNFQDLVRGFEEWAKMVDSSLIFVSDMGMNEARTAKLYEHMGYTGATSLVKRIEVE